MYGLRGRSDVYQELPFRGRSTVTLLLPPPWFLPPPAWSRAAATCRTRAVALPTRLNPHAIEVNVGTGALRFRVRYSRSNASQIARGQPECRAYGYLRRLIEMRGQIVPIAAILYQMGFREQPFFCKRMD